MGRKKKEDKKLEGLDRALAGIEKKFGKNVIVNLGKGYKAEVKTISTGLLSLDLALGVGGLPRGRVIEIYGNEASGKTSLALNLVKEVQKQGGKAVYVDAEHALDDEYARDKIGVDLDKLITVKPDCGEDALNIVQSLVESAEVDLIIVDSVASLVPKAEVEGDMGDVHMGLQARLMSQALRKLTSIVSKTNTCLIFINQTRMKIGVMFGNPETTPGGKALKYYCSVRLDLRRIGNLKNGEDIIGTKVRAKVVKNKVAPPFRKTELKILNDEGFSVIGDILDLALVHGIIKKSGAWFSYEKENIGQGWIKTRDYLKENPEILEKIKKQILNLLGK